MWAKVKSKVKSKMAAVIHKNVFISETIGDIGMILESRGMFWDTRDVKMSLKQRLCDGKHLK